MDNAQKAIMIGVGLFITIIIISAVLLITNLGTGLITNAQGQLSSISKALQNQITAAYDGKTMTGAEVVAACQQYENSEMSVVVAVNTSAASPKIAYTGKYKLDWADIYQGKTDDSGKPLNSLSYPGGVYYTGTLDAEMPDTDKTTLTQLQGTGTGNFGVNAAKTYYSSIIKDASTDTVVGVLFVQK